MYIEKYPFFFNVSCSCKNHNIYPNILAKTGSLFIIPAFLFLYNPSNILTIINGSLILLLTTTSITYHLTHDPLYRCIDILILWTTFLTTTIIWVIWIYNYCSIYLLISSVMYFINIYIEYNKCTYYLNYHIFLHFNTIIGLSFYALHNIIYN